jgi:hypothetical protein
LALGVRQEAIGLIDKKIGSWQFYCWLFYFGVLEKQEIG